MRTRLDRSDIQRGLNRLLELCVDSGLDVRIQIVGGGAVLLNYNQERQSTVDVDCVVLGEFEHREKFAEFVLAVAGEFNWPVDWMNHKVGIFWPEAVFDEYFPYDVMPERTIRWLNERLTR